MAELSTDQRFQQAKLRRDMVQRQGALASDDLTAIITAYDAVQASAGRNIDSIDQFNTLYDQHKDTENLASDTTDANFIHFDGQLNFDELSDGQAYYGDPDGTDYTFVADLVGQARQAAGDDTLYQEVEDRNVPGTYLGNEVTQSAIAAYSKTLQENAEGGIEDAEHQQAIMSFLDVIQDDNFAFQVDQGVDRANTAADGVRDGINIAKKEVGDASDKLSVALAGLKTGSYDVTQIQETATKYVEIYEALDGKIKDHQGVLKNAGQDDIGAGKLDPAFLGLANLLDQSGAILSGKDEFVTRVSAVADALSDDKPAGNVVATIDAVPLPDMQMLDDALSAIQNVEVPEKVEQTAPTLQDRVTAAIERADRYEAEADTIRTNHKQGFDTTQADVDHAQNLSTLARDAADKGREALYGQSKYDEAEGPEVQSAQNEAEQSLQAFDDAEETLRSAIDQGVPEQEIEGGGEGGGPREDFDDVAGGVPQPGDLIIRELPADPVAEPGGVPQPGDDILGPSLPREEPEPKSFKIHDWLELSDDEGGLKTEHKIAAAGDTSDKKLMLEIINDYRAHTGQSDAFTKLQQATNGDTFVQTKDGVDVIAYVAGKIGGVKNADEYYAMAGEALDMLENRLNSDAKLSSVVVDNKGVDDVKAVADGAEVAAENAYKTALQNKGVALPSHRT